MIIHLTLASNQILKETSDAAGKNPQDFLQDLFDSLFKAESCYFILTPVPAEERLDAIRAFIDIMSKPGDFFGFKFLNEEEAMAERNKIVPKFVDCKCSCHLDGGEYCGGTCCDSYDIGSHNEESTSVN